MPVVPFLVLPCPRRTALYKFAIDRIESIDRVHAIHSGMEMCRILHFRGS